MRKMRLLAALMLMLTAASAALADFDGPAPLSWRWAQPTNAAPAGAPLVDNDTIYVSNGERVYALDRATGNQEWKFPTTQDISGTFKSNPILCNGVLVAATDSTLYGIDPKTGIEKWYYKVIDHTQSITHQPVATSKYVVFQLNAQFLVALDGTTGKEVWPAHQEIFDQLKGNMAVFEDSLYYFTGANALCMINVPDPSKIKTLANFSELSDDVTPVVDEGTLYINSSSYVDAFNAYSGSYKWQTDTGEDLVYGPAVSAYGVAVVSRDGVLTVMDTRGRILSMPTPDKKRKTSMKIDLQSGAADRPTAAGKFFAQPTINGAINLVDPSTGDVVWRYVVHPMSVQEAVQIQATQPQGGIKGGGAGATTGGTKESTQLPDQADYSIPVAGPLVCSGNTLLLFAADGSLLAFDKTTGVDATGPEVKMAYPSGGSDVSSEDLPVVFRINDDDSGVNPSTISVTVNGQKVKDLFTADGLDTVRFSLYGDNKLLPDGRADFDVTVSDWMGNTTEQHFYLTIDSSLPPLGEPPPTSNQQGGGKFGGGGPGGRGRGPGEPEGP